MTSRERTEAIIRGFKNQTFGCEIEMNEITRPDAAKIIAKYFGDESAVSYDGTCYDTYSATDNKGRKWKCMRDSSIEGNYDNVCEMVTPILRYEDMNDLQEIVRLLRKAGAKSSPSRGCGVHVHIGAQEHTPETLRHLVNLMAAHENIIVSALGIDEGRLSEWCKRVDQTFLYNINKKKPKTFSALADVWYDQSPYEDRHAHYNRSRYHILNLHAFFTKGTVEFRLFQFFDPANGKKNGLHAGLLRAYVTFALAVNYAAINAKRSSPRLRNEEREYSKRRMRSWLYRDLGLVGDEFETVRDVFTRGLPEYEVVHRNGEAG